MHRTIKITVMILLWIFVAAFVVVFDRRAARHRAETKVRALAVDIVDSLRDETLVSSDAVRRWTAGSKIATVGVPLAEVDLAGIEQAILRNGFVERANAYVTYDGGLRVEVSQRRPLLRLLVDGYDCYVTADGFVFPAPRSASAYVPVVTGSYAPPVPPKYVGRVEDHIASRVAESEARIVEMQYEKVPLFQSDKAVEDSLRSVRRMRIKKGLFESHDHFDERVAALRARKADLRRDYRYRQREIERKLDAVTARQDAERENQKKLRKRYEDFLKLINFVSCIEEDSFWRAEIVQIVVSTMSSGDPEIELVPRAGDHTVLLGSLDDVDEKLERLLSFYENGLRNIGWESFRTISVKYKGQVVCTK